MTDPEACRYFLATADALEAARQQLNVLAGLPANGQVSVIPRPADLPVAPDGRVALGVRALDCEHEPEASFLAQQLAAGACEEIDRAAYDRIADKGIA